MHRAAGEAHCGRAVPAEAEGRGVAQGEGTLGLLPRRWRWRWGVRAWSRVPLRTRHAHEEQVPPWQA